MTNVSWSNSASEPGRIDDAGQRGVADLLAFLRVWIGNRARVAAIAPSSRRLAALMTREISAETGPVLELGPGTGVFTRALLARGVRESDLTLVECLDDFARLLNGRFPAARIVPLDAVRLGPARLFDGSPVGAVVSGLPLRLMPPQQVYAILRGAFGYMRPGGALFQFTYRPLCPISRRVLDRLGLKATRIGNVVWNVPPAAVYRIEARRPSPLRS